MKFFMWVVVAFISSGSDKIFAPSRDLQNSCVYLSLNSCPNCAQVYKTSDSVYICEMCNYTDNLYQPYCYPAPLVTYNSSLLLNFENSMKLGTDETHNLVFGRNSENTYPNFDTNDPIPSLSRGYYFHRNSYMRSQSLNLSPWFTVVFWIKPLSEGKFFSKRINSRYTLKIYLASYWQTAYVISFNNGSEYALWSFVINDSSIGSWHNIAIECSYTITKNYFLLYIDGISVRRTILTSNYYYDGEETYVGNERSVGTFTGFIWRIIIYGSEGHALDDFRSSNCNSGCSFCTQDSNCPDDCQFKQFNNDGICNDCSSDCNYGCRSAESCNLCEARECLSCDSLYGCTSCLDFFCSSCTSPKYFSCTNCLSGHYLVGQVCLNERPYKWDSFKNTPYAVIEESFKTETFTGLYGIFITGEDINTFAPFNSSASDPIPMVKRGLYFHNGAYLKSNISIYLPYEFTMNLWIKPKSGDFLEKFGKIIISYNFLAAITLETALSEKFPLETSNTTSLSAWTFYSLVIAFSDPVTTITTHINGDLVFNRDYEKYLFRDLPSNYLILGKSTNSNFTGFIYSFQLVIGAVTDFSSFMNSACGELSNSCLSECEFNYYIDANDNSCKQCNSFCVMGCIRNADCNICADSQCNACSGFGEDAICYCNADSILLKSSGICDKCDNDYCGKCFYMEEVFFDCETCIKGVKFEGVCLDEIPYGYNKENCSSMPCLMLKANFEADFSGSYDIFDTSNSSSTFYYWDSPDSYDPIPVQGRGLYFISGKYLISHSKLYFPHTFSIASWINSHGIGDILEKDGKFIIANDFSVNISLLNAYQSEITKKTQGSESYNYSWNFLIFSTSYSNGKTSISIYLNGDLIGSESPVDYIFKDSSGYLTLGKSKNSDFKGFIYNFEFYLGTVTSSYLPDIKICDSSSIENCLVPCDISEYFDGKCMACNPLCKNGCVKANSCSICKDPLCKICPGFGDVACIECVENAQGSVCECNPDSVLIKTEIDWSCKKCDTDYCEECTMREDTYFSCKCLNRFWFEGACLDEKPYKFDSCLNIHSCLVIDAEFSKEFGDYNIFTTGNNENQYYFFEDPELIFDSIPAIKRGLYFKNSNFLKTNKAIYLSHSFAIGLWINPQTHGALVKKEEKIVLLSNGSLSISLRDFHDKEIFISTPQFNGTLSWYYLSFSVSYSSGATTIYSYHNNIQYNSTSQDKSIFRDISSDMIIGNSSFSGFIYNFKLYIGAVSDFIGYSEVSLCQTIENENCIPSCDLFYYPDGSTCKSCDVSCNNTCVRSSSCNLCHDQLCKKCSGFSSSSICYQCIEKAHKINDQTCTCDANTILASSGDICDNCDLHYCSTCLGQGYFNCLGCTKGELVDNVCLDEHPTGYEECVGKEFCMMAEINSKNNFNETYGKFIAGANRSTYNPFNSPEIEDPVLVKDRGFFFDGNYSFLQSEQPYYFPHIFSIEMWILNQGTGDILEQRDRLLLASDGSLSITLQDRLSQDFLFTNQGRSFEGWNFLMYSVTYSGSTTSIRAFLNNEEILKQEYPNFLFRDKTSSTLFIGKSSKSYFEGFLYQLRIWNRERDRDDFNDVLDLICGISRFKDCLSPCKANEFYSETYSRCQNCLSSCNKGCVRNDTCNICEDPLCVVCPNFGKTECIQCIPYASEVEKCKCIENYCLSLDRLNCIRVPYENSTELYWTTSMPEEKIIVGNWSSEFIINTIHDFIKNVELLNSADFSLSSNNCYFNPYMDNFTCPFTLSVHPDYNISNNPLVVQAQYKGYTYPIYFNPFYDDFSIYLMNHQQLVNIKYYFEISYLKIKLYSQIVFTEQFCLDDSCSETLCNKILSKNSIISFGESITCFRISKTEMEIYLGHIQDNTKSLTFIENVFADSNTNETNLAYITLSIEEEIPPLPKAIITPIVSICCSCNLVLDGSHSSSIGNLSYNWSLSNILRYSGDLNQRISTIILESCDIADSINPFNVTLTVTDKFGQSDTAWISVNMIYDEVAITIADQEIINIGTDSPLKLKFQYQKSANINLDSNPTISWSASKSSRQLSEDVDYNTTGIEFIHLFSEPGEYVVTASALFNHGTYARSASVKVVATPQAPNLMVLGVDTAVSSNSYITVNLTATYGSDEIYPLQKGSAMFTETSCIYGKFVEISGDSFNLEVSNKESYFICNFTVSLVDYPTIIENHWLFVSPSVAPKVYFITKYPFLDPSSRVRILVHVENEMKTNNSWEEVNNKTFTPITPIDQAGITIKEFSLIPGTEYEFRVTVTDKETFARSTASLKRYVNCPPNGGTFEIDHNSEGITLETEFGILFSGWSDFEENQPISYQIFIKLKDSIRALIPKTTENKLKIILGVIGKATLLSRIYDSYGTFVEIESIVHLTNTRSVTIKSFTENLVANGTETMDSSLLISSITAAGLYISEMLNDEGEINDCISNSVNALNKWMDKSMKVNSLSDSSTVIDCINILLESSEYLNETILIELHATQDKALNKTKYLDSHTYMQILENIDLIMKNLGSFLDKNSSSFTELEIYSLINKTFSEASLKYLISINPNEEPMNYAGEKFNSTCRSVNKHSIESYVAYNSSKPNTEAQFIVDTSKNSDSTIYLLSILTLNPFKNISDGLQKETINSYIYSGPFTANEENWKIKSPDTHINSNFAYSDQYESSLVQVGISQNINTIFNPVITYPPLTSVSVMVAYDAYDENLKMTCSVYLQQISQFSFKFCETYFNTAGIAICKCEIVGLVMILDYPSVLRNMQDRIDPVMIDVPKVGAIPVFIIFGSLLLVFYLAWLDISSLDKIYTDPLKELTLNINEIIEKEVNALSSNLYVNKQKIQISKLTQVLELGKIYEIENEGIESEERKESTGNMSLERYEAYPNFKKQLRNKLDRIIEAQDILDSLLTFERIMIHTENCIDKQNLEDLEMIVDELFNKKDEENEKFLLWTQLLYKEKSCLASLISKFKQKKIQNFLRASYSLILYLSSSIEFIKRKIKYKHYNYIIQAIKKSILSTIEEPSEIYPTNIKLKCESKEILITSIEKLEGNIFSYIKLKAPTLKLERFIKSWIFLALKESVFESEESGIFIRNITSRKESNILAELPMFDISDIRIEVIDNELEAMDEKINENKNTATSFSILPRLFTKLLENQIDNFTSSASFIQLFIKNNDIFGIIGSTDLNFSRKARLIYLLAAISTEIAIAISAFDGYTKYIDRKIDLIVEFPEIALIIWLVSFILGFLPLCLKIFLKDQFLKSHLIKNKYEPTKNWKAFIGYLLSFSWIAGCWFYSFEKLNNYPISNIGAYLLYILQSLLSFLVINGLILPTILATIEMNSSFKFIIRRIKRWVIILKRRISKYKENQTFDQLTMEFQIEGNNLNYS